jgi:phosphohistidine phosphatase
VKTLLLLRHGKAEWGAPVPDHDRTLRKRGRRDAARVGRFLAAEGLAPEWIWSSTAERAADTARRVVAGGDLGLAIEATEALYGAEADEILEIVAQSPDWAGTVLVVGHNPGMEEAAEALTRRECAMATCSLAVIELAVEGWPELSSAPRGSLRGLWHPSELPEEPADPE